MYFVVQGGTGADDMIPDSSPENIRRSVDAVIKALDGKKKLDLFECARVDSRVCACFVISSKNVLNRTELKGFHRRHHDHLESVSGGRQV